MLMSQKKPDAREKAAASQTTAIILLPSEALMFIGRRTDSKTPTRAR
jgi:hypothetical protein